MNSGRNTQAAEVVPSVAVPVPEVVAVVSEAIVGTKPPLQKVLLQHCVLQTSIVKLPTPTAIVTFWHNCSL